MEYTYMKNRNCLMVCVGILGGVWPSFGAAIFGEGFDNYVNGSLTNQGPWLATASATAPIQVASGRAQLATSGQDAYAAFGSAISNPDGTSFFYGLTINVTSTQAAGDYFFHVSNPAGTTLSFYERLFAKSAVGGFQLGFVDTSGTGSTITYGLPVLSLGTDYRVVVAQNFVAGPNNDTFSLYVNPTDLSVEGNNTPFLTHTWTSTSVAETATYAAVNLRQGSSANAAAVFVDDILVSKTYSDVASTPEPSTICLALAGAAGLLCFRRRR